MMLIIARIICFAFVPLGAFLLSKILKFIKPGFYGDVIVELSFADRTAAFNIKQEGIYAIWIKGPLFARTLLHTLHPAIYDTITGQQMNGYRSWSGAQVTGGSSGRMELSTFTLPPGSYRLELESGNGLSAIGQRLHTLFPGRPADPTKCFAQLRESQPFYYKLIAIPFLALSGIMIIGGFVMGFLIEKVLPELFN